MKKNIFIVFVMLSLAMIMTLTNVSHACDDPTVPCGEGEITVEEKVGWGELEKEMAAIAAAIAAMWEGGLNTPTLDTPKDLPKGGDGGETEEPDICDQTKGDYVGTMCADLKARMQDARHRWQYATEHDPGSVASAKEGFYSAKEDYNYCVESRTEDYDKECN